MPIAEMKSDFWDERYRQNRFLFSTQPNAFLLDQVKEPPETGQNRALAVGDGEGRNGVWLADASTWAFPEEQFDLIVLFYFHLPREAAIRAHAGCVRALKPGGRLLLEGFRKQQMPLSSGGPKGEDWMYAADEIQSDFGVLEATVDRAVGRVLREGRLHGSAAVYQFAGRKAR